MLPNDAYVILSSCIAVVDYTCIKSVSEYSKFIRLYCNYLDGEERAGCFV